MDAEKLGVPREVKDPAALEIIKHTPSDANPTLPERIQQLPDAQASVLAQGMVSFEGSFETGEQITHKVFFPYRVIILAQEVQVTKTLAGTDAGTITLKNHDGAAMDNGVITLPLSTAAGTTDRAVPTTNQGISGATYAQVTFAKTTAGGRARVTLYFSKVLS